MRAAAPFACLAALLLAGCSSGAGGGAEVPPARGLTIAPGPAGLNIVPTGQEIGFGRFQPGAVAAVSRILGRAPAPAVQRIDCVSTPLQEVRWPRDDLALYFADQAFVGWASPSGTAGQACQASA